MEHQGYVAVAGGHLGVVLPTHQQEEVARSEHEAERHGRLVGVVAVDGQVDVGGDSLRVVHAQHTLVD